MERVAHKALSHEDAARWDVEQHVAMSPEERLRAARMLKDRAYPSDAKDVRAWHRSEWMRHTSHPTLAPSSNF